MWNPSGISPPNSPANRAPGNLRAAANAASRVAATWHSRPVEIAVIAVVVARMTSMATAPTELSKYSCPPAAKQQMETFFVFTSSPPELRQRERPEGWAGGWHVRTHPSAVLACRFRREAALPIGRCKGGLVCRSDLATQTGSTCLALQTLQCRNRTRTQIDLHTRGSDFHRDQRGPLP